MKAIWAKFTIPVLASILILGLIPFNDAFVITENAKIKASNEAFFNRFGQSVSVSGDTVVVGSLSNIFEGIFGTAYVFEKPGTVWAGSLTEDAKLTPSVPSTIDEFGGQVYQGGKCYSPACISRIS